MKKNNVDIVQAIGVAIKNLRMQKGLSQYDLEALSGVGRSYIVRLEQGKGNPSFKQLQKLTKALDGKLTVIIA